MTTPKLGTNGDRDRWEAELRSLQRRRREILEKQTSVGAASGASGWNDSYTFEHRRQMNRAIRDGHGLSAIEERIEELERQLAGRDSEGGLRGGQAGAPRPTGPTDERDRQAREGGSSSREISRAVLLAVLAAIAVAVLMTVVALAPRLIGPSG